MPSPFPGMAPFIESRRIWGGVDLSGGAGQKLALARAYFRAAQVLKAICAPGLILVQQGSRMDTVVETSEIAASAPCKARSLNAEPVEWCALRGPFCALVRVPAVAHTHPAGALWQKCEPH
jgi:hypothetical protein